MKMRVTICSLSGRTFTVDVSDDCYWIDGVVSMPSMVADLDTVILGEEDVTGKELAGKLDTIRHSRGHDCLCDIYDCWKLAEAVRKRWYLPQG